MTTIHIIRTSPFHTNKVKLCLTTLTQNDSVLLIDDGCYLLNHQILETIKQITEQIYVIESHSLARGLETNESAQYICFKTLNELIFTHNNSITWQ